MALTKTQIEALTGEQVNDLVTEQVMNRVRFGEISSGGTTFPRSWGDKKGTQDFQKGDGLVEKLPNYELSQMPEATPDYLTDTWHSKLVGKMLRKGHRMELFQTPEGTYSAAFYKPPAVANPIVAADDRDAVRRAALLAVQA